MKIKFLSILVLIALIATTGGAYALARHIPYPGLLAVSGLPPLSRLSLPPQTVNGVTASLESYYVDAARLVFALRVTSDFDNTFVSLPSLKDENGADINADVRFRIANPADRSLTLIEFNPAIPLTTSQLNGQLSFAVVTSPGGDDILAQFRFDFDLPVHPTLTLEPKQSFLSIGGVKILLDRIVITPAQTYAYLCYTKPTDADWMIGRDATLKIGHRQITLDTYSLLFDSTLDIGGKSGETDWIPPVQDGRCVKIGFPIGNTNPQSITLTIPTLERSMPEVIPAEQLAVAFKELKTRDDIDMEWHIIDHGAYPEWKKLPAGMSEQQAYRKFIEALGYVYYGQWEFNIQLNPQENFAPVFSTSIYGAATPIPLSVTEPHNAVTLPGVIRSFDVSLAKGMIVIATSQGVFLYDFNTYERLHVISEAQNVSSVAWSPDGTRLAIGGVEAPFGKSGKLNLTVWDTTTWKIISEPEISAEDSALQYDALAWSPDGTLLATAAYERGAIVLNVETGEIVSQQADFIVSPYRIAWSPDGSRLIATGDLGYGFRRWRIDTDEFVRLYDQRVNSATDVAWSPDGDRISSTHENGAVCFWTVETNTCDSFIQAYMSLASSLAWSLDGKQLATGAGAIRIWDVQTGKQVCAFGQTDDHYIQLKWLSPDTLVSLEIGFVVDAPPTIRIFDVQTGNVIVEFHGEDGSYIE